MYTELFWIFKQVATTTSTSLQTRKYSYTGSDTTDMILTSTFRDNELLQGMVRAQVQLEQGMSNSVPTWMLNSFYLAGFDTCTWIGPTMTRSRWPNATSTRQ